MRVLLAEDDPVHTRLVSGLLGRWGHEVSHAGDGVAALELLEASPRVQLAIIDWMMPKLDGLDLCREIRRRFNAPYLYVILLTARDQREDMLQGFEAGADDYLVKPVHHTELHARLRAAERIIDLQAQLLAAQERLRIQATHDPLTGILNRRAILDALAREIDRSRREGGPVAALMIDLDHFKRVNDAHGHLVGDAVLQGAAKRIGGAVRSYDSFGRYGGEEFLVVTPGQDSDRAHDLAERIRRLFEQAPLEAPGLAIPLTLSLGVVAVARGEGELGPLLSAADAALYEAKRGGRNRTVVGRL